MYIHPTNLVHWLLRSPVFKLSRVRNEWHARKDNKKHCAEAEGPCVKAETTGKEESILNLPFEPEHPML